MDNRDQAPSPNLHLPSLEEEILAFWERERIFERSVEERSADKQFVFFEGPPTANAKPAIHHVLGRTFKDAIPRYKTMQGYRVVRKAGWDTHGLPVELQVEKSLGISGKPQIENIVPGDVDASIARFNQLCKESVWQHKEEWERLTQRMGFWLDMKDPYITFEQPYIESVWWILKQLWDQQLLYEDFKVVPYCFRCGTALSSHEVALGYDEVTDQSIYVKFPVVGQPNTYLLAWTTTPWTLPGNVALAINPSTPYSRYQLTSGEEMILADERAHAVLGEDYHDKVPIAAEELLALSYTPLFQVTSLQSDRSYKVYPASFVTTTDGTGIVHTAVMYGEDDFRLGSEFGLPKQHTVDVDGNFTSDVPSLAGKRAKDAGTEQEIATTLEQQGLLFRTEPYTHTYPFCWRCTTPLLYYAKRSWFIAMSQVRDRLIANNATVHWVPGHLRDGRFGEWLREVKDWALSRDRYWGTPLPIWHCDACEHKACIGSYEELATASGQPTPSDVHRPGIDQVRWPCTSCTTGTMSRYPEVIDVWFDSGAMPFAQQHYPFERQELIDAHRAFPADYIAEGIDQTRGWFYTLLAISTLLGREAPYKTVVSYGHLLDKEGKKMSKSKGNVIDPWEAMAEFGIDPIRWYFYSVNQPADTKKFNPVEIGQGTRKVFLIAWNMLQFYRSHVAATNSEESVATAELLDTWLRERTKQAVADVTMALDDYDFFHATRTIRTFCTDVSTWYLRLSRKRADASFRPLLGQSLRVMALLLAPFAPFFAESLWQEVRQPDDEVSVHLARWPTTAPYDQGAIDQMQTIREVVEQARAVRAKLGIPTRQPLAAVTIQTVQPLVADYHVLLKAELNVKDIHNTTVKGEQDTHVTFDTELTDELRAEGLAREVSRAIQGLRKEAGLSVGEQAYLVLTADETHTALLHSQLPAILMTTSCVLRDEVGESSVTTNVGTITLRLARAE